MKDKREKAKNTVWLNEKMSIETNNFRESNIIVVRCLALLLFLFSVISTLNATINMPFNMPIFVCTVLFAILFTFISDLKKFKGYAISYSILASIVGAFLLRNILLYGVEVISRNFIEAFNKYYYTDYVLYEFDFIKTFTGGKTKTIFIIVLVYILSLIFSFLIKKKQSMLHITAIISFMFWMSVNFGETPHVFPILLIFLTFMSIYTLENESYKKFKSISNEDFAQNSKAKTKHHYYYSQKLKTDVINRNWVSVVALSTSIIILILVIFPKGSYKPNEKAKKISDDPTGFITSVWDSIPKSELFNDFLGLSKTGVGNGDLTSIDRKGFSEVTHLKVASKYEIPMLLKGYVGSVYSSDRWSDLNKSIYDENSAMFSELERLSIYPSTIGSLYMSEVNKNISENNRSIFNNIVTVENIKANKEYAYVPYNLKNITSEINPFIRDTIVDGNVFDTDKYKLEAFFIMEARDKYLEDQTKFYSYASNEKLYGKIIGDENEKAIKAYTKFVYDNYLEIPSGKLEKIKADLKPLDNYDERDKLLVEIAKVKNYLREHAVYDLAPGKIPKDKDYIEYFLYENHKGYCTHFATAATMMFRSMGIPARYVEGYTVTNEDYQKNKTSNGEIDIKDSNAHAWTEIYLPMYGWIPVDVTPGFSNNSIAPPVSNVTVPYEMSVSSQASSDVSSQVSSKAPSSEAQSSSSAVSTSTADTSSEIDKEISKESSSSKPSMVLIVFSSFFGIILAFFLILFLKYFIVTSKRKSNFTKESVNTSIVNVYSYLLSILSFIGYNKNEGETEIEFAIRVTKECNFINDDTFINVTQLALKAKFSNHTINNDKLEEISSFSNMLNEQVYESLKPTNKFKYWLIDNLK